MLPDIDVFWMGSSLGPVHAAGLRSLLRHDRQATLHNYDRLADTPIGFELFDPDQLMPRSEFTQHRMTQSITLDSGIDLYGFLRAEMRLSVDRDILCIRPFPTAEYLLGQQSNDVISSAVVRTPNGNLLVTDRIEWMETPLFPPLWRSTIRRNYLAVRRALDIVPVVRQTRGTIGSRLATLWADRNGLLAAALPVDTLSPVNSYHSALLFDLGLASSELVTSPISGIHDWESRNLSGEFPASPPLVEIVRS